MRYAACMCHTRNAPASQSQWEQESIGDKSPDILVMWTKSSKVFLEGIRRVLLFGVVELSCPKKKFIDTKDVCLTKAYQRKTQFSPAIPTKEFPENLQVATSNDQKILSPKRHGFTMASCHVSAATRTDPRAFCKDTWRHVRVPWYHGVKCRQFFEEDPTLYNQFFRSKVVEQEFVYLTNMYFFLQDETLSIADVEITFL